MALNTNDLTSNNNDLTNVNSVGEETTSLPFFYSDTAATFNGSTQYLYIADGDQTGLDLNSDFTLEAWIYLDQLPSTAGDTFLVINKDAVAAGERSYVMQINSSDDRLEVGFFNSNGFTRYEMDDAFDSGDVGKWVHVACSVDIGNNTFSFYKNGSSESSSQVQQVTATDSIINSSARFCIGARDKTGGQTGVDLYLDGKLDDVRIWSDIRTGTEIADYMNRELAGNEANLVAYYPFETDIESTTTTTSSTSTSSTSTSSSTSSSTSTSTSNTSSSTSSTSSSTSTSNTSSSTSTSTSSSTSSSSTSSSSTTTQFPEKTIHYGYIVKDDPSYGDVLF